MSASEYEREISITFTLREIMLLQDAVSDKMVEWRQEVKRRIKSKEPYDRLLDNLVTVERINDDLKAIRFRGR